MQHKTGFQKLIKFFSLISFNKKDFFWHFLQSIIRGANPLIHVIFIEKIVLALSNYDPQGLQTTIFYYMVALILFEILWIITRKVGWIITIAKSEKEIYDMYLNKFIQMDNNEVEKIGVGKIIAILENGRLRWGEGISAVVEKGTSLLLLLCYVLFVTLKHGYLYTLGFFLLLSLSITLLFFVNKHQFRYRNKRSELRNDRLRLITKVLMSKNEILQTGRIQSEISKIQKYCQEMSKVNVEMSNGRTIQNRAIPFTIGISLFMFVLFYSKVVLTGSLSLSQFVGITSIFLVVNSSVMNFIAFYIDLTKDFIDIEKMWSFFEDTKTLVGYENGNTFQYNTGNIEVQNLNYAYHKGQNIFQNFSTTFSGGKITALVGNSGGGKTTLVKLISGYIKPDSGDVIVDHQKLSEISLKSYFENIGYLTQEPSVFDGTILENLTYAVNKEITKEELDQIIRDSNCEFIYDLPKGIDTQIGERGVKLSGGQKQRLAIAKIMLKNPKIIFLDEPTSALDSFSEEQITKALHKLFEGKTVIIIAHRLQTVKHADRIIVIENGSIVQDGNHEKLSKLEGTYKKMLELQSGF